MMTYERIKRLVYGGKINIDTQSKENAVTIALNNVIEAEKKVVQATTDLEIEMEEKDFLENLTETQIRELNNRVRDWLVKCLPKYETLVNTINQEEML